ncbi:MAG: hypothetical protein KC501_22730, partial [Myxococcales bacterium]|nr:hypothetical protein [Myxococcales bacterium]
RVEQLAQEEAAKRQQEGRRRGGRARAAGDASGARAPEAERTSDEAGRALDRLAKDLGLGSRRTVERLRKVVRKAEEDPERYGELVDRLNAGVAVGTVVKELERIDEGCGRDDYASPEWIPAGVRQVEGRPIDLDPATNANAIALGFVAALTAWTIDENALAQPTWGVGGLETLVYMNPPYSDPGPLVMRLSEEFDAGAVARAYVLVKLDTSTSWWRALRERAAFVVEPDKRVAHYVGKRPKKGSDFCSAMVVLARGTGLELLDLYGRLIDEFGDRADVRPTRWALQYMRALQRKLREART